MQVGDLVTYAGPSGICSDVGIVTSYGQNSYYVIWLSYEYRDCNGYYMSSELEVLSESR